MKISRLASILKGELLAHILLGFITFIIYLITTLVQFI